MAQVSKVELAFTVIQTLKPGYQTYFGTGTPPRTELDDKERECYIAALEIISAHLKAKSPK